MIIGLEPGELVEHQTDGVDLTGAFECVSSLWDSARSEVHESPVEVTQGLERLPRLIKIRGLIETTTQREHAFGDRLEKVVGHLLRLGREDVDACRQDQGRHSRRFGDGFGLRNRGGQILEPQEIEVDEDDRWVPRSLVSSLLHFQQG